MTGSMPLAAIAADTAGDARNAMSARPPLGLVDPAAAAVENTVTRCTAGGSGPTPSIPATGRDVRALTALQAIENRIRRAGHRTARHDDQRRPRRALERGVSSLSAADRAPS